MDGTDWLVDSGALMNTCTGCREQVPPTYSRFKTKKKFAEQIPILFPFHTLVVFLFFFVCVCCVRVCANSFLRNSSSFSHFSLSLSRDKTLARSSSRSPFLDPRVRTTSGDPRRYLIRTLCDFMICIRVCAIRFGVGLVGFLMTLLIQMFKSRSCAIDMLVRD